MPKDSRSHKSNEHRFSPYIVSKKPPKENKKRAREEEVEIEITTKPPAKKLKTSHNLHQPVHEEPLNSENSDTATATAAPTPGILAGLVDGCGGGAPSYITWRNNPSQELQREAGRLLNKKDFHPSINNSPGNPGNSGNSGNPDNPEINLSPRAEASITNKIIFGIGSILFSAVAATIGYCYSVARASEAEVLNLVQNNSTSQKTLINLVDKTENIDTLNLLKNHRNCQSSCKSKLIFSEKLAVYDKNKKRYVK